MSRLRSGGSTSCEGASGEDLAAAGRSVSLDALRLAIFAAAGLSVSACELSPLFGPATGAGGAGTTSVSTSLATDASSSAESSSATTASSSQSGTGGGGPVDPVCEGAMTVVSARGTDSGIAQCPDGTVHRNHAATCDPTIAAPACTGSEQNVTCQSDADCTSGPHGRCVSTSKLEDMGVLTACGCHYACANDAECGDGKVCICNGVVSISDPWSSCAPATCLTGADCASGECGVSEYFDGCNMNVKLECRAATDACRTDADCFISAGVQKSCVLFSTLPGDPPTWQCKSWTCILGRPFVVDGVARVAEPKATGWGDDCDLDVEGLGSRGADPSGLDDEARRALAEHWLAAAALEHASVASFARFTLELLGLGAPPELVVASQSASIDEVLHARIAYGLASRFLGREVGPGPLDVRLVPRTDRREIVRALVTEACVGETLGVADALLFAEAAREPELVRAARRVADDEARHAELAWRALRFILETSSPDDGVREEARIAFEDAIRDASVALPRRESHLGEWGLSSSLELAESRRLALSRIVAPTASALLAQFN